jgi:hypothetical protein
MLWQHELNTKLTEHAVPLYLPFKLPLIPPGGVLLKGVNLLVGDQSACR